MTAPTIRRVDQHTGTIDAFPSRCVVCQTPTVWFCSRVDRLHWELQHQHGGED